MGKGPGLYYQCRAVQVRREELEQTSKAR
jgi:hypothetical protein